MEYQEILQEQFNNVVDEDSINSILSEAGDITGGLAQQDVYKRQVLVDITKDVTEAMIDYEPAEPYPCLLYTSRKAPARRWNLKI